MRKLVLCVSTLALASLAACGGGDAALITANWSFSTVAGANIPVCPPTFTTAEVHAQSVTGGGEVIDLYTCDDFTGTSAYALDDYDVFIAITTEGGGGLYGETLTGAVDISDGVDKTYTAQLLDDGGYFSMDWQLKGAATNANLDCSQVNPDSIEIQSTFNTDTSLKTDKFDCIDLHGTTAGLLAGDYMISAQALNASDAAIGTSADKAGTIQDHNGLTDLGLFVISIDGM